MRLGKAEGCHSLYQPWIFPTVGWDTVGTGEVVVPAVPAGRAGVVVLGATVPLDVPCHPSEVRQLVPISALRA